MLMKPYSSSEYYIQCPPRPYVIPFLTFIYPLHPSSLLLLSCLLLLGITDFLCSLRLWLRQIVLLVAIEGIRSILIYSS